jgi:hypothetical protein
VGDVNVAVLGDLEGHHRERDRGSPEAVDHQIRIPMQRALRMASRR